MSDPRCNCALAVDDPGAAHLHQRLHAVEAARAREMQSHGELVRQLQLQVDAHRVNEKQLQLTVAKVRADKCRLEAETACTQTKLRTLEQESIGREQRHERLVDDFRQRLLAKEQDVETLKQTIHRLQVDNAEATVKLDECHSREKTQAVCIQRLTDERDDARASLAASTTEIARLAAELSGKQCEIDRIRCQLDERLLQLNSQQNDLGDHANKIQVLCKSIERLEISRLRLAQWKQSQFIITRRELLREQLFVAWKTETLASKAIRIHETKTRATATHQRVDRVHQQLTSKLDFTKTALQTTKAWLQIQQQDLRGWTELSTAQFTTLVSHRLQDQQAHTQRIHDDAMAALRCEQLTRQAQHDTAIASAQVLIETVKRRGRRRVDALTTKIHSLAQQKLRTQAFQGWKDVYLRNVVAQTTHALMVARAARTLVAKSAMSPSHCVASSRGGAPAIAELYHQQPQHVKDVKGRDEKDEEELWKRWRRVTPVVFKAVPSESRASTTNSRSAKSSVPTTSRSSRSREGTSTTVAATAAGSKSQPLPRDAPQVVTRQVSLA